MAKKKKSSEPVEKTDDSISKVMEALIGGKKLSADDHKVARVIGEHQIEEFMKAVGIEDPSRLTDQHGWRHLQLESAAGIAGIKESEDELYLHVEADVIPLPSDRDLIQALMREALEFNVGLPGGSKLGIRGTQVVVSATESMRGLSSAAEYGQLIHRVMALANAIDDDLKQKYGGTTRKRNTPALAQAR
jgi:hypothetical protein